MEQFNFKKKYGQNFLRHDGVVKKIVNCAEIDNDSLVIEVGPGKGILTKELMKTAKNVLCYEIDSELKNILEQEFLNTNVNIIYDDFLTRNINEDIMKYQYESLYFVSNLPYYITTPILVKLIDEKIVFNKIVIMVQEEVGNRFSAKTGTKDYSSITVFLNYFYDLKKEFKVNRKEFIPAPNVDSIVISLTKKEKIEKAKNEELFFKLVRDSFKYKRKNIRNNLKNYNLEVIKEVLQKNGFDLTSRAEELPLSVFIEISNNL